MPRWTTTRVLVTHENTRRKHFLSRGAQVQAKVPVSVPVGPERRKLVRSEEWVVDRLVLPEREVSFERRSGRVSPVTGSGRAGGILGAMGSPRDRCAPRSMMSTTGAVQACHWIFRWRWAGDRRCPDLWEVGWAEDGCTVMHDKDRIRGMTISNYDEQASAGQGS